LPITSFVILLKVDCWSSRNPI